MNETMKPEKTPYQLGLPPMELAETIDQNSSSTKRCLLHPLIQKITAVILIILCMVGAYIILNFLFQGFDCGSTEIVIVNQNTPNVTIEQGNIEIFVHFKNKTETEFKRTKRDVMEGYPVDIFDRFDVEDTTNDDINSIIDKFNDENIRQIREIISKHDVPCNNDNQGEICKKLVTTMKTLTDKQNRLNSNLSSNLMLIDTETQVQQDTTTSVKRDTTGLLADVETLKPTPHMPFEAKESYGYVPEPVAAPIIPTPFIPYSPSDAPLQIADSCLLAKLLKQQYPHAFHDISRYSPPHYEGHILPYSRYVQPAHPASLFQSREADTPKNIMHHQDAEILMDFLTPQSTDRTTNSSAREAECGPGKMPCNNGEECILESQWCDGNVDCADVSDEFRCNCKSRVDKSRLCDGYFDCPFGEDEMGCYGCSESTFSCVDLDIDSQSTCFTKEQRCNNVADCPNGRDEMDCTMLAPTLHRTALYAISNTEGFLHRNFKGNWFAVCKNPYMWAHDACRRETGLIIRPPFIQILPVDPMLKVNYLNTGEGGLIHMSNTCFNNSAIYVTCPDLLCGTRIMPTTQILRENPEVENHLFGRNKRYLIKDYPGIFYNNRFKRQIEEMSDSRSENLRSKRTQSRVVGGRPSQAADWPWMVAMYRDGMFHCGGVVLTQKWVISAAHCMHKYWDNYFEIRVGMLRRFSFSPQEANHKVTHVIVNHKYKKEDMKNDISLLKVTPAIQFSRWVRPICLPGLETAGPDWLWGPPKGTICMAVGWGATIEHGPDPDHLREVEVPIWGQCKHSEDRAGKEICAGLNEGGRDACQGDSGGPLLCRNPRNSQQWYMAGIVSHGDGCGRKGEPGVYTRVSLFVKWIRHHIFSEFLPSVRPKQECTGFKCVSGIAKCLPSKRVCDKIVDCLGGEDEISCDSMRSPHQFENIFLATSPEISTNSMRENKLTKQFEDRKHSETVATQILKSNEKSSEQDNMTESNETVEPFTTTNDDLKKPSRGDLDDSISNSLPQKSLESGAFTVDKSSLKEADINENWDDLSPMAKTLDTSTTLIIDNTDGIHFTTEPVTENKETSESGTTTQDPEQLQTLQDSTTNTGVVEPESKDFSINLSESHTTTISQIIQETIILPQGNNLEDHDKIDSKMLPEFENKQIIDTTTKYIVSSEIIPAKMKRQHRVPKDFECRRIIQIVPYHERCDGKADCEDGTDELSCTCADYLSRVDQRLLCDGVFDCADGQDEMDCFSCPEDHFLCKRSQQCLPSKYVCDEKPQCLMGEDELECFALTNGQNIEFDLDGAPKINLQGFLTKKHDNDWHVVCDDNLTTEQQEVTAGHICHYLGFSSANRFLVKHINVKEEILRSSSDEDTRSRRNIDSGVPVHFAYRKTEDTARHLVIKEPTILKEQCVPNVTKTCMSLYVYCDHILFTNNFEFPNEILYNRAADVEMHMWPWVAKVYVDGDYRCSGVLVDLSWTLVSHSCLWDVVLSHHLVTIVLGSSRTFHSNKGMYEQTYKIDAKKDLFHTKAILLHLKEPAQYSSMVKPMILSSNIQDEKPTLCLAIGQDENNTTVGIFLEETYDDCDLHNRCFIRIENNRTQKQNICGPGMVSRQQWAGIISCHTEQGWYPVASFVDSRGECGIGNRIVSSEIGSLKNEMKHFIGRSVSDSVEMNSALDCDGVRCGRGRCVTLAKVCDGIVDCEDQNDEQEEACKTKTEICTKDPYRGGCACSSGQLKCHNGKCIGKELFKNGYDDCGDGTDEPSQMSCAQYLAKVKPGRLCDGILHCKDRTDEDPLFCKCFAKKGYRCNKDQTNVELCVSYDVVCDGVKDCPNGEDEKTCLGMRSPVGTAYGTGQVIVQSHGVWHTKCYRTQNHTKSELEAICRELGFISGHAKQLEAPPNFTQTFKYVLSNFSEVFLNNNTSVTLRNTDQPLAKAVVDESMNECYPVYIECL